MKRLSIALALLVGVVGCGGEEEHEHDDIDTTGADAVLALTGDEVAGETVYGNCVSCHAVDGTGTTGPSMFDVTDELEDVYMAGAILNGVGDEMPAFGGSLSDQDVADVIAYVRANFSN